MRALRGDVLAGLTVGVILVPQGMAYAVLAGVPPVMGLYACLVPLLIYPFLGSSRHLAVGIVAIDCMIIAGGLSQISTPMTEEYVSLAILLAFIVGVTQIAMGVLRLGFIVNLLSRPVSLGFLSGAVITIGISQLPNLLGIQAPDNTSPSSVLIATVNQLPDVHMATLLMGLGGIGLILTIKKWLPRLPAPLIAVVLGGTILWAFSLDEAGVAIVGEISSGLPSFEIPAFRLVNLGALFPTAITLVLVQFMTVISLGSIFAAKHRYRVTPNRELVSLGAMNLFGAFFRAIPVSGSFSRTAINEQAGAESSLSNVVAASVVGIALLFLTPLFRYLPVPLLAAIVIVAIVSLIDIKEARYIVRTKRVDGVIALGTLTATLVLGIHQGILFGVLMSAAAVMYRVSRPNIALLGHLPGSRSYRELDHFPEARSIDGIEILRLDASFAFTNAAFVRASILRHSEKKNVRAIILDASSINDLDTTALAALIEVTHILTGRNIDLYFGGMKVPVFQVVKESGLIEMLGEERFCLSPHRAVKAILHSWGEDTDLMD